MTKECIRRPIQNRPAQRFLSADFFNQAFRLKRLNGIIAFHAADKFDFCLCYRLAVCDHRKGFHNRLRKGLLLHRLKQLFHIRRVIGTRRQLNMRAITQQPQASAVIIITAFKRIQRFFQLLIRHIHRSADFAFLHSVSADKQNRFHDAYPLSEFKLGLLFLRLLLLRRQNPLRRLHRHPSFPAK